VNNANAERGRGEARTPNGPSEHSTHRAGIAK